MCPDCDNKIKIFDGENTASFLREYDLDLLELPMTRIWPTFQGGKQQSKQEVKIPC